MKTFAGPGKINESSSASLPNSSSQRNIPEDRIRKISVVATTFSLSKWSLATYMAMSRKITATNTLLSVAICVGESGTASVRIMVAIKMEKTIPALKCELAKL
jgi:hypothetical protein